MLHHRHLRSGLETCAQFQPRISDTTLGASSVTRYEFSIQIKTLSLSSIDRTQKINVEHPPKSAAQTHPWKKPRRSSQQVHHHVAGRAFLNACREQQRRHNPHVVAPPALPCPALPCPSLARAVRPCQLPAQSKPRSFHVDRGVPFAEIARNFVHFPVETGCAFDACCGVGRRVGCCGRRRPGRHHHPTANRVRGFSTREPSRQRRPSSSGEPRAHEGTRRGRGRGQGHAGPTRTWAARRSPYKRLGRQGNSSRATRIIYHLAAACQPAAFRNRARGSRRGLWNLGLSERVGDFCDEEEEEGDGNGGGGGGGERAEGRRGGAQPAAGVPVPPNRRGARGVLPLQEGGAAAAARAHHRRGRPLQVRSVGSARCVPLPSSPAASSSSCSALLCFFFPLFFFLFITINILVSNKKTIFNSVVNPFIQSKSRMAFLTSVLILSFREGAVRPQGVVLLHAAGPQVPKRLAPQPRRREGVLEGDGGGQADRAQGQRQGGGDQEGARVLLRQGAQGHQDGLDHARVPPRRRGPRTGQEGLAEGVCVAVQSRRLHSAASHGADISLRCSCSWMSGCCAGCTTRRTTGRR